MVMMQSCYYESAKERFMTTEPTLDLVLQAERKMFELSFQRPKNYFHLTTEHQWQIDYNLGILDWQGQGLSEEDMERFRAHYE